MSDFGISRVITQEKVRVAAFQVSNLRGASIAYASPDALVTFRHKIQETDPKIWIACDVYALSMSLMEMLKRGSPWH